MVDTQGAASSVDMDSGTKVVTMRQASRILGIKSQNLRRYCNRGFVPGLRHSHMGQPRTFTPEQLNYLRLAHFLTQAGFVAKDLRKYVGLMQDQDEAAREERRAMLLTHKRQVWQRIEDLQETIDFLERQEEAL